MKKLAFWLLGGIIAIGVLGGLLAPPLAKFVLTDKLTKMLHRPVSIGRIAINPYALTVRVEKFLVREKDSAETALSFDELYLDLTAASLWNRALVLNEIHLKAPYVRIVRIDGQRYNFSDLLEEFRQPGSAEGGPPARFSLNNIRVSDGRIDFEDRPLNKKHTVDALAIALPFASSLPYFAEQYIAPAFSARVNGTAVALAGKTRPFHDSRETVIDLNFDNFDLTPYVGYLPLQLKFKLASGLLDSRLALHFAQRKDETPRIELKGSAALKNMALTKTGGEALLSFARLAVQLRLLDLGQRRAQLASITLEAPALSLIRQTNGKLDVVELLSPATPNQPTPASAAPPYVVEVSEAAIRNGRVTLRDETVAPAFRAELKNIGITARDYSSAGNRPMRIDATLATAAGETLNAETSLQLTPLQVEGSVALKGVRPRDFAAYYRDTVLFDVEDGSLETSGRLRYAAADGGLVLSDLAAKLDNFRLRQRGVKTDFLELAALQVSDGELDLAKRSLVLQEVTSQGGKLAVTRDRRGQLNLSRLTPPARAGNAAAAKSSAVNEPWRVAVGKVDMNAYQVGFVDQSTATPVKLTADNLALTVDNFSTAKGSQAGIAFKTRINKRGTLQASGPVSLDPLIANVKLDARNLDIVALQPYFTEQLKIALVSGAASAQGALSFRQPARGDPNFAFRGNLRLAALQSIDKANGEDFLKWKSLDIRKVVSRGLPLQLEIGEIALADFYSRLIVNADGKLNLQQILVGEGGTPESGTQRAAPPQPIKTAVPAATTPVLAAAAVSGAAPSYKINIGSINLAGGSVDFSDRFIRPNYSANLTEIGGTVSALSSDPATRAEVRLKGRVNNDAPLEITGTINPLARTLYLDLAATAKGIELSPASTYTAKYAGYGIEKGKLSVDLKYRIEDNKLTARNRVFLDQLTFGAKVESPDATKLPVLLAVALLKDRNGNIDIDLPVSGSLDDPQFSIGGLIVKVIVNLLVKVATAPFALLGALFDGGEELNYVEFDPGKAALSAAAETKLKNLAKALADRPALKLEITGRASREDAAPARQAALERKLRAQKLALLAKEAQSAEDEATLKIAPEEYPKLLEAVYKQEKFKKPRNLIGFAKSLPPKEMEQLILTNTALTDEDLTELANARARAVRDWLAAQGQIAAERMFLVAAKLDDETPTASRAEKPDGGDKTATKTSRADLSLK